MHIRNTDNRKNVLTIVKIVFSVGLLYFAFSNIRIEEIYSQINELPYYIFILLFIIKFSHSFLVIEIFISLFKFLRVVQPKRIYMLKHQLIASVFFLAIPGVAAPDAYLTACYSKVTGSLKKTILAIFLNRIIGLIIFLAVSFLGCVLMFKKIMALTNITPDIFFIALSITIALIILFVCLTHFREKLFLIIKEKNKFLAANYEKLAQYRIVDLMPVFIRKFIWYLVSLFSRILIAKLIGINLSLLEIASIIVIVNFLVAMPISISGIGVREVSFVSRLGVFGVSSEKALLLAFLDLGIILTGVCIGAMILIFERIWDLKNFIGKAQH